MPHWRWRDVFSTLLEDLAAPQTVSLVLTAPGYLEDMGPQLGTTEPAAIYNYLAWRLAIEFAPLLPTLPAATLLRGSAPPQAERPERLCLSELRAIMGHAAAALLAPPVGSQARSAVRDAVATATDQLKRQLVGYLWMSEAVSQRAVHKLNALQAHLFYPAFVEDKMVLEQIYRQVPDTLGQQPALLEWFRARSAVMLKRWKALAGKGLPPLALQWLKGPEYSKELSFFGKAVGVRSDIFCTVSITWQKGEMNGRRQFGKRLCGFLKCSREPTGAFHDESGALHFWWERSSFVRLQRAENCLVRHHAADPVEALLDQVALQAAYAMYKQRQGGPEVRLAALPDASGDQLFSLAFATGFCAEGDDRLEARDRVNLALREWAPFHQAFGCLEERHSCSLR
ncbi:hypothetical protein HPB48_008815 [Haemaphysalis longicornis]|uniref:Peptidase M13 N-terminal domain-containing protein n=1 Tax=Haemaphysalis longicornis TaxID=44386 RepID=A0A9J6H0A3_HAELO|nr:hypothetical protein HPB48_008815 [Haemaphysalis longicornis]